jgi:hypothetical protein
VADGEPNGVGVYARMSGRTGAMAVTASMLSESQRERFWGHVDRSGECWEWRLATNGVGYGTFSRGRRDQRLLTHRVAYALEHGETPAGVLVCHTCDNRRCVRPSHLFLGDHKVNAADMVAKGRDCRGGTRGNSKHTPEQVREIRRLSGEGLSSYRIGEMVGVKPRQVRRILSGEQWGWAA